MCDVTVVEDLKMTSCGVRRAMKKINANELIGKFLELKHLNGRLCLFNSTSRTIFILTHNSLDSVMWREVAGGQSAFRALGRVCLATLRVQGAARV